LDSQLNKFALNLALKNELLFVAEVFSSSKINSLFIKGECFSSLFYGALGQRFSGDIDVVVSKEDLKEALSLLFRNGYQPLLKQSKNTLLCELAFQHAIPLIHKEKNLHLDLHWNIIERQFGIIIPIEAWLKYQIPIEIEGRTINTLDKIRSAMLLVLHGSKSLWQKESHFLDLKAAISSLSKKEQKELLAFARSIQLDNILGLNISLLTTLDKNLKIDDELKTISEKWEGLSAKLTLYRKNQTSISESEQFFIDLTYRTRLQRTRYILGRLFIPHDSDWETPIPTAFSFLHYAKKPIKTTLRALKFHNFIFKNNE
jgi:Uncharacterised nucleotidyltransferase